ncbi:hypothetical protein SK128_023493, partial [Halocaridina rubra]
SQVSGPDNHIKSCQSCAYRGVYTKLIRSPVRYQRWADIGWHRGRDGCSWFGWVGQIAEWVPGGGIHLPTFHTTIGVTTVALISHPMGDNARHCLPKLMYM